MRQGSGQVAHEIGLAPLGAKGGDEGFLQPLWRLGPAVDWTNAGLAG